MPEDNNKHLSSNDDSSLFNELMSDVQRLSSDKENLQTHKAKPKPHKKSFNSHNSDIPQELTTITNEIESNEHLSFSRQGIQPKLIRQLKRGQLMIDDRLDLHGLQQQQAHAAINEFIEQQVELAHRCVIIVHGKGTGSYSKYPVLKNLAFHQLKTHPMVLALTSTQPRDGGTGALYVLLKRTV